MLSPISSGTGHTNVIPNSGSFNNRTNIGSSPVHIRHTTAGRTSGNVAATCISSLFSSAIVGMIGCQNSVSIVCSF